MPFLSTEAMNVYDCQTKHFDFRQGLLDGIKLRGLDDGKNEFHDFNPSGPT
jgi:hypothetical protein